jgi:intracellular septation protein
MSALFTLFAYMFDDNQFVKIQPTIFNGFFSSVLLIGIINKKAMMKQFFGSQFFLNDDTWYKLSLRWGLFFLFLTIINEIAWRNLETEDWVFIKVFILTPLIGIFMLCQLPLTLRGRIKIK